MRHPKLFAFLVVLGLIIAVDAGSSGQTKINEATQVKPPGTNGQLLYNNNGVVGAEDPIFSQAYVNLFNAQSATTGATSSAVRNPIFSQSGTLIITFASITGSPASCTLQMKAVDSLGNVISDGSALSVTAANGTTSQQFTASSTLQEAAQIEVTWSCSTFPTAGTITVDFAPTPNVNMTNAVAATNAAEPAQQIWDVYVPTTAAGAGVTSATKATITTASVVKASAGNIYGVYALNGASSVCWVEFINAASAPSLGSSVLFSVPLPASTTQPVWIPFTYPVNASAGISVGIASANGGSSACGTAGNLVVFYQ